MGIKKIIEILKADEIKRYDQYSPTLIQVNLIQTFRIPHKTHSFIYMYWNTISVIFLLTFFHATCKF